MSPLGRTEWLVLTAVLAVSTLWHAQQIHWPRFVVAFALIDLLGYLPGAVAFRRASGGPIPPVYTWLYNLTHNFVTNALLATAWALLNGGWEWAMLALPLHLAGDRGLFGNGFKRADQPFEQLASRPHEAA